MPFGWKMPRLLRRRSWHKELFFDEDGKPWLWWSEEEHRREVEEAREKRRERYRKLAHHYHAERDFEERLRELERNRG
jgi:hypothetical protein